MNTTVLEAVLFDMDGLTVDSEATWLEAEIAVTSAYGGVWTHADQVANLGGPLLKVARNILVVAGRTDVAPELVAVDLNAEVERLLRRGPVRWMPGARELLTKLAEAGVPRALVSASHRSLVDAVLSVIGDGYFVTTVAGDDLERTKPFPDPYLLAAARLGVDPTRCIVLEDSLTGIQAGEAAGCVVVAVPSVAQIPDAPGRTVISSLTEVDLSWLRSVVADRAA